MGEIRENPEFVPEWDVRRDGDGEPITVTWEQVGAIWHAVSVVEMVRRAEGYPPLFDPNRPPGQVHAELYKSRLLGRMVIDGKPPTRTKPPNRYSEPRWDLMEGGDPFGPATLSADTPEDE